MSDTHATTVDAPNIDKYIDVIKKRSSIITEKYKYVRNEINAFIQGPLEDLIINLVVKSYTFMNTPFLKNEMHQILTDDNINIFMTQFSIINLIMKTVIDLNISDEYIVTINQEIALLYDKFDKIFVTADEKYNDIFNKYALNLDPSRDLMKDCYRMTNPYEQVSYVYMYLDAMIEDEYNSSDIDISKGNGNFLSYYMQIRKRSYNNIKRIFPFLSETASNLIVEDTSNYIHMFNHYYGIYLADTIKNKYDKL